MTDVREQHMVADNDTIIITDPCYLMKDEDWDEFLDKNFSLYPTSLADYLRNEHDFGEVIAADTGIGDWNNEVYTVDGKDTTLGRFSADAGMVAVFTFSDLSNYGYDEDKLERLVKNGCATIIPNYSGDIMLEYEYTEDETPVAVIMGTGRTLEDVSWSTLKASKAGEE